jgi:hypothetical protein
MGLDLILLPFDADYPDLIFSHTVLLCERSLDLFAIVKTLDASPVPAGFNSYLGRHANGERCYGPTAETAYGDPLAWVSAYWLCSPHIALHPDVQNNAKNRAIWAYLAHIPALTKVALYWC